MIGYIRLYRGWRDCDAFCDERLSEREAWLWLLENAAYRPAKRRNGKGEIITIERGQIHVSDRSLASAWDWDKKHVRRFLDRLSDCGMVDQSRDQSGTILSILNYEKYQSPANDTGTGQGASEGPAEDQPRTTHKEGKEGKEEPNGSHHPARKRDDFPKPAWAEAQVWSDFLANRRRKKLANTPTAHKAFLDDIARLTDDAWPPGRLLSVATGKGHGAIYPSIKEIPNGTVQQNRRQGARSSDGFINALGQVSGLGAPQH